MNRSIYRDPMLIGAILVLVIALGVALLTQHGGANAAAARRRSWCSYAARGNGSRLLTLAQNPQEASSVALIARGLTTVAPHAVEADLHTLIAGINELALHEGGPSAATRTAAERVDAFIVRYCAGRKHT
jgi:hypothetical protein